MNFNNKVAIYVEYSSTISDYGSIAWKGTGIGNLWDFLRDTKNDSIDQLIAWAKTTKSEGGGTNLTYLFGDKKNIYIGFFLNNLTDDQDEKLKNNSKYFFKTTRQHFVNLLKQWKTTFLQQPPGIAIEEKEDNSWSVASITQKQIEACTASRAPKTWLLPKDFTLPIE
jgi:hypothetical protein